MSLTYVAHDRTIGSGYYAAPTSPLGAPEPPIGRGRRTSIREQSTEEIDGSAWSGTADWTSRTRGPHRLVDGTPTCRSVATPAESLLSFGA
jgi:hypothetical protein